MPSARASEPTRCCMTLRSKIVVGSHLVMSERSQLGIVHVLEARADLTTQVANAREEGDCVYLNDGSRSFPWLAQGLGAAGSAQLRRLSLSCRRMPCCAPSTFRPAPWPISRPPGHLEFHQIDQRRSGRCHRIAFHLGRCTLKLDLQRLDSLVCNASICTAAARVAGWGPREFHWKSMELCPEPTRAQRDGAG